MIVGLAGLLWSCTTDPVIPPGVVTTDPPVQDPGEENLCEDGVVSFQHEVMPIIVSSCAYSGCHDARSRADDIVLENYSQIRSEVKPGDPNDSELYESITESDLDDVMPPPPAEKLNSQQILVIKNWILQGAENTNCGTPCDPTNASFAANIFPTLQNYCVGCHNSNRTDGNVNLESYDKILPYVDNGSLIGSIRADQFYPVMPPAGSMLSACRITQIETWIADGALNN